MNCYISFVSMMYNLTCQYRICNTLPCRITWGGSRSFFWHFFPTFSTYYYPPTYWFSDSASTPHQLIVYIPNIKKIWDGQIKEWSYGTKVSFMNKNVYNIQKYANKYVQCLKGQSSLPHTNCINTQENNVFSEYMAFFLEFVFLPPSPQVIIHPQVIRF